MRQKGKNEVKQGSVTCIIFVSVISFRTTLVLDKFTFLSKCNNV